MDDTPSVLDVEQISRLRELGQEDAGEMLRGMFQRYLESIPPQLTRMREALAAGNTAVLVSEAHGLAGSSAVYALPRLRHCCLALETHAREQRLDEAGALLDAVQRAFEEAAPLVMAELSAP
ncbi:hypothetical protein D187_007710 [Cystobacter fuscus DSM 2262]|uniref:HPt domain-containing protein n=1 Tax=Cystobacter fuscus (strain ATCC 25194 / DSM 2262 / NBRC 100088 / M29) TaxID=1242864 RepID=S9QIR7_CYSF2|nr:Hpt domain-containing protein [Cystobacter fuscus]EPX56368.1 hypothetical protein D187_007710 [Cystobacter fuscus DSM 2262]